MSGHSFTRAVNIFSTDQLTAKIGLGQQDRIGEVTNIVNQEVASNNNRWYNAVRHCREPHYHRSLTRIGMSGVIILRICPLHTAISRLHRTQAGGPATRCATPQAESPTANRVHDVLRPAQPAETDLGLQRPSSSNGRILHCSMRLIRCRNRSVRTLQCQWCRRVGYRGRLHQ